MRWPSHEAVHVMIDERPTAYDGLAHIILTCSLISLVALCLGTYLASLSVQIEISPSPSPPPSPSLPLPLLPYPPPQASTPSTLALIELVELIALMHNSSNSALKISPPTSSPPPPTILPFPPLPPPPPPAALPPITVDDLNQCFLRGRSDPSVNGSLAAAGVLLRQFDSQSAFDKGKPWLPCTKDLWCAGHEQFWPSSIVNKHTRRLYYPNKVRAHASR